MLPFATNSCAPRPQLIADGRNTQKTTANGAVPERAVDGNTDGAWSNGSVTLTAEDGSPEPWWQVTSAHVSARPATS